MNDQKPKESTKKSNTPRDTARAVKPVLYKDTPKDTSEEPIDLKKAYDWTKKYSYDPEGRVYIRTMPGEGVIDPKDDPELNND